MAKSSNKPSTKRINTIDILRGFALLGILYAHMIIWYTGAALPPGVYSKYDGFFDGIAMGIFGGLVFGKFFSVFSFLFGLGFFLNFRNKKAKERFPVKYIWRLFLLFLIGVLHHTIWRGDILSIYATLGLLLLTFRYLPLKLLLFISLLLIINLPTHIFDIFQPALSNSTVTLPMAEGAKEYYSLVAGEGFITVVKENWRSWPAKIEYQLKSGRLLMTFGYFLLGLYAGRTGLFTSIGKNLSKFRIWNKVTGKIVLILLLIGLLMYLAGLVTLPEIHVKSEYKWPASFLFSIYNACLTIFYISGITLLNRRKVYHRILAPLAAMGKMALTNYLLQTAFGLFLFYHFGLGLFDRTSLALNAILAIAIFYLQLKFSLWWLQHYKQGPVEWLWKSLTNFKFISIRRKNIIESAKKKKKK